MTLEELLRRARRPYRWPLVRALFLLVWRLREREVGLETTGSGKSSPDYPHGKVTGLSPDLTVTTETVESPYVCCGYCSAAMVVRAVKPSKSSGIATAHAIRSEGGRPHDNGSRASELRDGAKRAHGVTFDPLARAEVPERLADGYAVVVNVDYADLPGFLRVQGGSFGHSLALFGWREDGDLVGVLDPLWAQGARGAWCPWSQLSGALWADGEHSGTVERYSSPPPEPPPPDYDDGFDDGFAKGLAEGYVDGTTDGYSHGYASGLDMGGLVSRDEGLELWVAWLVAPPPAPVDVWGVGSWSGPEQLDEVVSCEPGSPARWSRGPLPSPARDARAALASPPSWGGSTWAGALWRGSEVDDEEPAALRRS